MPTKTASVTGNWATGATWGGSAPSGGEDIVVNTGITVTVAANLDLSTFGTLTLTGTGKIVIPASVTVAAVPASWTISSNAGTVTSNAGTITTNTGTVGTNTGTGAVTTNTGTVTTNQAGGVVSSNAGTVTTNAGTVTNTAAGIISNNTGTLSGTLNITSAWSITGGDLRGASPINILSTPAAFDASGANLTISAVTFNVFAPVTLTKGANTVTNTITIFRIAGPAGTVTFSGLTAPPTVTVDPGGEGQMVRAAR